MGKVKAMTYEIDENGQLVFNWESPMPWEKPAPACECGAERAGSPGHAPWCPKREAN